MNETIFRNSQLNVTMTKVVINNEPVVWAEDMREALKWDRTYHMVRGLKEGVEYYKVSVNNLKSMGWKLCPNLGKTSEKGGRPQEYVYFITEQGVTRLIATRRPHDIKDDPALAEWLDKLQNWIFGEVIPSAMKYGAYMTPQVAQSVLATPENAIVLAKALLEEHEKNERLAEKNGILTDRCNEQAVIIRRQDNQILDMVNKLVAKKKPCPEGYYPTIVGAHQRNIKIKNYDPNQLQLFDDTKSNEKKKLAELLKEEREENHKKLLGK